MPYFLCLFIAREPCGRPRESADKTSRGLQPIVIANHARRSINMHASKPDSNGCLPVGFPRVLLNASSEHKIGPQLIS